MPQKLDDIRIARLDDLEEIIAIYNQAILTSTATFDTEVKSKTESSQWFREHVDRCPILAAVLDKEIVGWGAISMWSNRKAYSITGETSLYIRSDMQGKGFGTTVLQELLLRAKENQFHSLMARIVGNNEGSIRLHERYGYNMVGIMKEAGSKFGELHDVYLMQCML